MILLFLAVTARILSNPLANVCQKQLTQRGYSSLGVNALTLFLLGGVSLVVAGPIDWTAFGDAFWGTAILVGLLCALGNGLLVAAMRTGELSVLGPINAYKSVVAIVFGILWLGEMPTRPGLLGVGFIVWGSVYTLSGSTPAVPGERPTPGKLFWRSDIQLRFWAMSVSAVEAVFIKRLITLGSIEVSMIVWCWFGAAASLLMMAAEQGCHRGKERFFTTLKRLCPQNTLSASGRREARAPKAGEPQRGDLKNRTGFFAQAEERDGSTIRARYADAVRFLLLTCFLGIMQYTTNYSFAAMPVGYALALFQLSALVSVFCGRFFFRESGMARKILGAAIMVAGAMIISLDR